MKLREREENGKQEFEGFPGAAKGTQDSLALLEANTNVH